MAQQWDVAGAAGICAVTGQAIQEGEEFYSVLFEDGEGFRRIDIVVRAWTAPPDGSYCHFRTRMPVREKRRRLFVHNEIIEGFFTRLASETEPLRLEFRFVLALLLMRKKLLRYERTIRNEGAELWEMVLARDGSIHTVANPRLTEERIEEVSRQLSAVLHEDMGEWSHAGVESPDGAVADADGGAGDS